MEDDWDLHAVVRSCYSTATTSTVTAIATATATATAVEYSPYAQNLSNLELDCNFSASWSPDLIEPRRESFIEELHDLLKPFYPNPHESSELFSPKTLPISPLSFLGSLPDLSSEQPQQKQEATKQFPLQKQQCLSVVNGSKHRSRSKKRKNHLKRVCHVPAEKLSSDVWSWRKYGQKPIKGSPYPRGYYKCSTSKGCKARKQLERNKSDPGMFIVTYTGEHNHPMPTHRSSLAGSTRQKPAEATNSDDSKKPELSPVAGLSPVPKKLESSRDDLAEMEEEEDDDDFSASKMELDDDFFAGLEDFAGDCLSDDIQANNATTTTTAAVDLL